MVITVQHKDDPIFSGLPVPLKSIGTVLRARNKDFAQATQAALHARTSASAVQHQDGVVEGNEVDIGVIKAVSGRTTPMRACMGDNGQITVTLNYSGAITFKGDGEPLTAHSNGLLVAPNHGGTMSMTHLAAISFALDQERLNHTVQALCGAQHRLDLYQPITSSPNDHQETTLRTQALFTLFQQIDLLLQDDQRLPAAMGLDDQIYRLVALKYIARNHLMDQVGAPMAPGVRNQSVLDELVSYIETHTAQPLSLTDLERRSHYTGRQLQNLFRERFDCSPMQFVKRQRLAAAMEQLQRPADDTTVTSVARGCGYHNPSSFSTDFQRRFGVCPSAVLRASRA
jgi:AraC-like DNA-binding protein